MRLTLNLKSSWSRYCESSLCMRFTFLKHEKVAATWAKRDSKDENSADVSCIPASQNRSLGVWHEMGIDGS